MEIIKSGNMSINPMAVKDMTKEELHKICKGKIADDFEIVWKKVCKANGNDASPSKPSKQAKKD